MKVLTYNFKGLTGPLKSQKVKDWLKMQGAFDVVVLTEIKCLGDELYPKLKAIDNSLHWSTPLTSKELEGLHVV